jgi:hypothetical protein
MTASLDAALAELARCHEAAVPDLDRALAEVAGLVDVDGDPAIGPVWHFYRVRRDLLAGDEPRLREFVARVSGPPVRLHLVAEMLALLLATKRPSLAPALIDLVETVTPPAGTSWNVWAHLADTLIELGATALAERLCDELLAPERSGPVRASAGFTKGSQLARTHRFGEARELLEASWRLAAGEGLAELADRARANLLAASWYDGDLAGFERGARRWLVDLDDGICAPPAVDLGMSLAGWFRNAGADVLALDLLSRYADLDWHSGALQLEWLEALIDVFRTSADDFTAADLCLRAISIDDRIARSTVATLGRQDYDRISRAYELLVLFHAEIERLDETAPSRALPYVEAAKEAAFSRALPAVARGPLAEEAVALTIEAARLERASERGRRGDRVRAFRDLPEARGIVVRAEHERERGLERRCAEIKARLQEIRGAADPTLTRFASFLDMTPDTLAQVSWPRGTVALSYRLDRPEDELTAYVLTPGEPVRRFVSEVAASTLDSLLAVLARHPEDEVDYIAERLSEQLLPQRLRAALTGADTLVVSSDLSLPAVPWEALGGLGLNFALCRSPSLLRSARQLASSPSLAVPRALVVADPTGDLPGAAQEGAAVARTLAAHGIDVTMPPSCTGREFTAMLADHPLVHFAGHTNYLRTDPASSHFLLADGPLSAAELAHVRIHPGALFVLGSCESARAGQDADHGNSFGLGSILLLNGAATVVASNWLADDADSLLAAESLYARLLRGMPVASALRAVRQALHARGATTTTWALFTMLGHPFVSLGGAGAGPASPCHAGVA